MQNYYYDKWKEEWSSLPEQSRRFKPILGPTHHSEEPRCWQVPLTRLRLGVSLISHGHIFRKEFPPECNLCHDLVTHHHLLMTCPKYAHERSLLRSKCQEKKVSFNLETVLTSKNITDSLIQFLENTNIISNL